MNVDKFTANTQILDCIQKPLVKFNRIFSKKMFVDLLYDTQCKIEAQFLENIWRQQIAKMLHDPIYDALKNVLPLDVIEIIYRFITPPKLVNNLKRTHHLLTLNKSKHPVYGYYIEEYVT